MDPESPDPRPAVRFHCDPELRDRARDLLDRLDAASDPTTHRDELAAVVLELTETGLEEYFMRSMEIAKVGFVAQQSARLGIGSFLRVMGPVTRRIVGGMSAPQLRAVAGEDARDDGLRRKRGSRPTSAANEKTPQMKTRRKARRSGRPGRVPEGRWCSQEESNPQPTDP